MIDQHSRMFMTLSLSFAKDQELSRIVVITGSIKEYGLVDSEKKVCGGKGGI
jgi:hypothetical protein